MKEIILCIACDKPATNEIITIVGDWKGKPKYWCAKHYKQTIKELTR